MGVMKEWECAAHGEFVSDVEICPKGCRGKSVKRVFLTPIGIKSDRTKFADQTFRSTADRYKLTDMSNKDGMSVMENQRKKHGDATSFTVPIPQAGVYDAEKHTPSQATGGALAALADAGGRPDNVLADAGVKPEPLQKRTQLMAPNWGDVPKP